MDTSKIKATPDMKNLQLTKGTEVMSPEGVEEQVVVASQMIITLTQGGKFRGYLLGMCGHVHQFGVHDTEALAKQHAGAILSIEGQMLMDPGASDMIREILLAKFSRKPPE